MTSNQQRLRTLFYDRLIVAPGTLAVIESISLPEQNQLLFITGTELVGKKTRKRYGVICKVRSVIKSPDSVRLVVEGQKLGYVTQTEGDFDSSLVSEVDLLLIKPSTKRILVEQLSHLLGILCEKNTLDYDIFVQVQKYRDGGLEALFSLLVTLSSNLKVGFSCLDQSEAKILRNTLRILDAEVARVKIEEELNAKISEKAQLEHRVASLKEQLNLIREELSKYDDVDDDLQELKNNIVRKTIPEAVRKEVLKQVERVLRLPADSPEYSMTRTYVEFVAELPWGVYSSVNFSLDRAKRILNKNHFGQNQVKERILEYLCVTHLTAQTSPPILCFIGPPGVGKTSFARSIAEALGRKFERISLGGIRDEAEIRGHRKAYIGSTSGRIIQAIKSAGSMNPVIVLDEIDKIGHDFRGDPSAALLEALDPEQNSCFVDHYLGFPFDLSQVIFICTANSSETIPPPLLDRLEVVEINGYSLYEKERILERFLLPKQLRLNGLSKVRLKMSKESRVLLIEGYTRESGLRGLDREVAKMCRKLAKLYVEKPFRTIFINEEKLTELLGPRRFTTEFTVSKPSVGVVLGLAWTEFGGEVLPIEVSVAKGRGNLHLTGQLGTVMQESARLAKFFLQANAKKVGLSESVFEDLDIHVHGVYGGVPKDGPSAGAALCVAMYSALTGQPVDNRYSITGELTLSGSVLPVGGIREKVLASARLGVHNIILPADNRRDMIYFLKQEIKGLNFLFVSNIFEVFELILKRAIV